MDINSRAGNFEWIENWASIPDTPGGRKNGRTHAVAVAWDGSVIVFHQAVPAVLTYDSEGALLSAWGDFPGAHGMTLVRENGQEYLWLTDEFTSAVVKTTLDGREVMRLDRPEHPAYENGKQYIPTWAAQNPETGEIWVADGYGAWLVHCFSPTGELQFTLDGTEGAGSFSWPHGVHFTTGANGQELFIADRGNGRITVYDGRGNYLRSSGIAHSPCCFDFSGDAVLIPELFSGVKILDKNALELIAELGKSDRVHAPAAVGGWPPPAPEGWPDLAGTEHVRPGYFNSPHGACFAQNGDIYVVEWIVGGRITKLRKR